MRTYLFFPLLALFSSLAGCSTEDTPNSGYPAFIDLYLDFRDCDGKKLPKSYVEMVNARLDQDGNLDPIGNDNEWYYLKAVMPDENIGFQDTLFGPLTVGGNVEETIKYEGQPLERDYYYLFRFFENDIDTVRVHSTFIVTERDDVMQGGIAIFYNGELATSVNWLPDKGEEASGIYFFEKGKIVSRQNSAYPIPWILRIVKEVERTG